MPRSGVRQDGKVRVVCGEDRTRTIVRHVVADVLTISDAVYPTRYVYDTAGRLRCRATMRRSFEWDETRWEYDVATGNKLAKIYADHSRGTM